MTWGEVEGTTNPYIVDLSRDAGAAEEITVPRNQPLLAEFTGLASGDKYTVTVSVVGVADGALTLRTSKKTARLGLVFPINNNNINNNNNTAFVKRTLSV